MIKNFIKKDSSRILIIILLCFLFVLWWPTKDLPYWWDSAGIVIDGAHHLLDHNFWPFDLNNYKAYAHVPLFPAMIAVSWKIFGESLLITHLFNLFFAALIIIFVQKLAVLVAKDKVKGKIIGFCVNLLLLMTPLYTAQLGIVYLEIPSTAFGLMAIYFYLKESWGKFLLSGIAMVLTKEVNSHLIGSIFLFDVVNWFLFQRKLQKTKIKALLKRELIILLPLLALVGFYLYHKLIYGWFFVYPGITRERPLNFLFRQTRAVIPFLYLNQWRFILSATVILSVWKTLANGVSIKKIFPDKALGLFLMISLVGALAFGLTDYLQRYVIICLPFFYLFTLLLLDGTLLKKTTMKQFMTVLFGLTLITSLFFYQDWNKHQKIETFHIPPLEENLEYQDIIAIDKNVANYIEKHYPDSTVYTSFPVDYALSQPYQHYVSKPIKVKDCTEYQGGDIQLMVFHFFSSHQVYCAGMTGVIKWDKAFKFERNGKFMMLYIKEATPSSSSGIQTIEVTPQ